MERRSFVKKSALLSSIALIASPTVLVAGESNNHSMNVASLLTVGKKVKISGFAYDAETKKLIDARIQVKSGYGLFAKTRQGMASQQKYEIIGSVSDNSNKIAVKIEANGYKTYEGFIYLTQSGCSIHSEMWKYNPNFKSEFVPKNEVSSNEVNSKFDFYLVKA